MTALELREALTLAKDSAEVQIEFRLKTGYDEGTVFELKDPCLELHGDKVRLTGVWKEVGGW